MMLLMRGGGGGGASGRWGGSGEPSGPCPVAGLAIRANLKTKAFNPDLCHFAPAFPSKKVGAVASFPYTAP